MIEKDGINRYFTASILRQLDIYKLPKEILANIARCSIASIKYKLKNETPWTLQEAGLLAEYFNIHLDELAFGDRERVKRKNIDNHILTLKSIRDFLIKEGKTNTLGKLIARGFFKDLEK